MALENDVTASNVQSTANDPGDVQASAVPVGEAPRGGRGGFQGGQQRGSRGARRNGRGRGNQGNHNNQRRRTPSTVENRPAPPLPPPPGLGGGGSFGSRLTKDAETNEGEGGELVKEQDSQEENVEAEVCFICASTVLHNSVAPCNHRTCHICALRLRALYKTKACAHCRASGSDNLSRSILLTAYYRPKQIMSFSPTTRENVMKTSRSQTLG